ncbi:MAG: N-acetylmuramoyl-L-alanine amidase [Eubacteriales bacterium]|nr:N-acetylmuramoyl-L-alanine amidase [Eubacteriales bacterium]
MKKLLKKLVCAAVICLCACGLIPAPEASAEDIVIVLDPGHGRSESGAVRTWNGVTYREEVINLKIAQYAKKELETYQGVKVYLTHNSLTGSYMNRQQRLLVAKNKKASALVSIHINSTATMQTSLTGAYAAVPSTSKYPNTKAYAKKARELGKTILGQLNSQVGLRNNGFWIDDGLGIIVYGMKYKIPSMIIEHCFVSNPNDCRKYLSTNAQMKKMGVADATGIAKYFKLKKKGTVVGKNGWVTENGKKYFYINNVKQTNGWKAIGGKYYYFDKNGVLQTGVISIGGKLYLTNKNGVRQKGFVKCNGGNQYYANSKGLLYTGWRTYKKHKYYFDPKTGAACKGLKTIGKDKYYFNKGTCIMQTKWVTVSGAKMFFSRKNGKMMKNYWLKWEGKWYYLGSDGKMYKNVTKKIGKKTYKFNKNGVCTNRK